MRETAQESGLDRLIERRLSRRGFVGGTAGAASLAALLATGLLGCERRYEGRSSLDFDDISQTIGADHRVAEGYSARVLARWGDPLSPGLAKFDPGALSAATQAERFGYNNDFLAYFPLPRGSQASDHGLLFVNHEYTDPELMFADWEPKRPSAAQTAIEMAAHGLSVIEVKRGAHGWRHVMPSRHSRRVTAETPSRLSGPVAGHHRLATPDDPTGRKVLGTLNNCAGGVTPWGTALSGEENVDQYFSAFIARDPLDERRLKAWDLLSADRRWRGWAQSVPRFDPAHAPNEINRFGWIVELDPYTPSAEPIKRTALGRFKHEGATTALAPDGRVVVYMGDDEVFQHLYRFVSRDVFDPNDSERNATLLDHGTLYVAQFDDEALTWLPLVHGQGPLIAGNGFETQADVLIDTRLAAAALGATTMDRPEDVEANPKNGRVYVMLTNNARRMPTRLNAPNPRMTNLHGHILELVPPGSADGAPDHAAERFAWNVFILAGDTLSGARYGAGSRVWLSSPDNCAFDPEGRLWIATDQGSRQAVNGIADGLFACDVADEGRALIKFFYAVPRGAECCGPTFTPDGRTLFVAVQHPGEGKQADGIVPSTFTSPSTRWPDFSDAMPPRPSVVVITRQDGGKIGGARKKGAI